jgi:hypothetical protein
MRLSSKWRFFDLLLIFFVGFRKLLPIHPSKNIDRDGRLFYTQTAGSPFCISLIPGEEIHDE